MYSEWAKDEIHIDRLEVFAHHGVYPEETREGQIFYVNAVLHTDMSRAGCSDELEHTVDYGAVCRFITNWMQENTCKLLEAVAGRLSEALLLKYSMISAVSLEIVKPYAPVRLPFEGISVRVYRCWHRAYIGLGSNLGDREGYLSGAVRALGAHPLTELKKVSKLLVTKPYGGVEQDDFLNGVAEIETLMNPQQLLEALHEIENEAGRKRTLHWGPRTLDLDILFYDKTVMETENLVIPHPDLENRRFVLEPMAEIAPAFRHPVTGKSMAALLRELEDTE
ncbi:MAG TPA: 2-amino-4-hydroxy-6-hydroxymethyldihydropteridine pyrophosphokinase [Lachnospiraceae bacterium]|nr:2-amino-4-hydroxy-6-hydroxymethyldihydropteridine pyrophosphokinase [Lachnospiraceae bacterium]